MKLNGNEKSFTIRGMDCASCAAKIEAAVSRLPGVKQARILFTSEKLKVITAPGFDVSRLMEAVRKMGYSIEPEDNYRSITLSVDGMDCADEQEVIEKKMRALNGVGSFEVHLMSQQIKVIYDPAVLSAQDIIKSIAETGMKASVAKQRPEKKQAWWKEKRQMQLLIMCGILTAIAFLLERIGLPHESAKAVYGLAILAGVYYPAKMGLAALGTLTLNIRLLMVVGAAGAVALGLWEEAALLVFVYSLGDVLEAYAVDRARGAIRALMALMPKEALVRRNGGELVLPAEEINIGDVVIVRPGEKLPVDGRVVAGTSFLDQSPITGESIPVEKKTGDEVFAGTINLRGSLEIDVTKRTNDTTLARIIHSVEEAQAKKSSYQRFGEKFGKYYTPAMFALGIGVALIPPLFSARSGTPSFTGASSSLSFPVPADWPCPFPFPLWPPSPMPRATGS